MENVLLNNSVNKRYVVVTGDGRHAVTRSNQSDSVILTKIPFEEKSRNSLLWRSAIDSKNSKLDAQTLAVQISGDVFELTRQEIVTLTIDKIDTGDN